jgi:hypothetical protein
MKPTYKQKLASLNVGEGLFFDIKSKGTVTKAVSELQSEDFHLLQKEVMLGDGFDIEVTRTPF